MSLNKKLGLIGGYMALGGIGGFGASMAFGFDWGSYVFSLFISWGYVLMVCGFANLCPQDRKAAGFIAMLFAGIYAALAGFVYFTQLTLVLPGRCGTPALKYLDFSQFGWMFSLDMLCYCMMSLSTFFLGLTLRSRTWLKGLLLVHGVFAISCFVLPMTGAFSPDMPGSDWIGVAVLEFWCAYFAPICILAIRHFYREGGESPCPSLSAK